MKFFKVGDCVEYVNPDFKVEKGTIISLLFNEPENIKVEFDISDDYKVVRVLPLSQLKLVSSSISDFRIGDKVRCVVENTKFTWTGVLDSYCPVNPDEYIYVKSDASIYKGSNCIMRKPKADLVLIERSEGVAKDLCNWLSAD